MTTVSETFRAKVFFESPDLWALGNHLTKTLNETSLLRRRLREVVMRSVVKNIRTRFLRQAEIALQMETIPKGTSSDGQPPWQSAKARYNATKIKAALNAEFDYLSELEGSGSDATAAGYRTRLEKLQRRFVESARKTRLARRDPENAFEERFDSERQATVRSPIDAQKERLTRRMLRDQVLETRAKMDKTPSTASVRQRIQQLQERLIDAQGRDPNGNPIQSHFLSKVRGEGMFRMNMAKLLTMITDMSLIDVAETRSGLGVGVGRLSAIETIRTPSATAALRGTPTKSRYATFWRHLEFGTGYYSKKAGNPGGFVKHNAAGVAGAWYYGNDKHGIIAKGSRPMNFITDANNNMYEEDRVALLEQIDIFMELTLRGVLKDTGSVSNKYTASRAATSAAPKSKVAEQWVNELFGSLGYRNERR